MPRRRFNPHRLIHNIKYWAFEIVMLVVFLHWLGQKIGHDFGLDEHPTKAQACAAMRDGSGFSVPSPSPGLQPEHAPKNQQKHPYSGFRQLRRLFAHRAYPDRALH